MCGQWPRLSGGGGLVSTLPDMVALVRSLLPGGPTLLKPETIAEMMTNQLPDGVWMRFPMTGELVGKGYGLAGALTVQPSPFDHGGFERRILVGRRGRHAMVDFAEDRRRRPVDDAAPDGVLPSLRHRVQAAGL